MSGRGISKLDPEARRARARKAARARWQGMSDATARALVERLIRGLKGREGIGFHVRNLRRLSEWLEGKS